MGAQEFYTRARGATARDAFDSAVTQARYQSGHGGYSGTIAEKTDFVVLKLPPGVDATAYAVDLLENNDSRVSKWGPAGCIKVRDLNDNEIEFLFFGLASS